MATNKGNQPQQEQGGRGAQGAQAQPPSQQQQQPAPRQAGTQVAPRAQPALARPSLPVFGPFALIRRLFDDIERLWGISEPEPMAEMARMFMPPIEVSRRGDKVVVRADLPGMAPDDIQVTVSDEALTLSGERRLETEVHEEGEWRTERSYGQFERMIPLPEGADPNTVEARFENGVLEISLRAPEKKERGRKVEINKAPGEQAKSAREAH